MSVTYRPPPPKQVPAPAKAQGPPPRPSSPPPKDVPVGSAGSPLSPRPANSESDVFPGKKKSSSPEKKSSPETKKDQAGAPALVRASEIRPTRAVPPPPGAGRDLSMSTGSIGHTQKPKLSVEGAGRGRGRGESPAPVAAQPSSTAWKSRSSPNIAQIEKDAAMRLLEEDDGDAPVRAPIRRGSAGDLDDNDTETDEDDKNSDEGGDQNDGAGDDGGRDDGDSDSTTPPLSLKKGKAQPVASNRQGSAAAGRQRKEENDEELTLVREIERELKKEHMRNVLAMEQRMHVLLAEKNAKIEMLEELLASAPPPEDEDDDMRTKRLSVIPQRTVTEGPNGLRIGIQVESAMGYGLADPAVLGATRASQGPIVSGSTKLHTLGTLAEHDVCFRDSAQVKRWFKEHFPWGPLDQPLLTGKAAFLAVMDALQTTEDYFVHLHARVASVIEATLDDGVQLSPSYMELLDALKTAGKPSDFDLFALDCGGTEVASSVVGGGAIFMITSPSHPGMHGWRLADVGRRRFSALVGAVDRDEAPASKDGAQGGAEARMLRAPLAILEGAVGVLLKMHVNLNAYPGQSKYTAVPVRSKVFGKVAAVDGAAEFLVEHGWVDDGGPKILFQGGADDVDRAVEALERMTAVVAKRKERACPGKVIVDGGSLHGSCFSWDEWRCNTAPLYQQWLQTVNHRSLMVPLRIQWKPLYFFVPVEHPLRARLRAVVSRLVTKPPPITDLVWVCADDFSDLMIRVPHQFVPMLRYVAAPGLAQDDLEDIANFPETPRDKGHRPIMVLCYRTGSVATRVPVTSVVMAASPLKGDEIVKCACGFGTPSFGGAYMVVARQRGELPVVGMTIGRPIRHPVPKNFRFVESADDTEPFNFLTESVDSQHVCVKYE